MKIQNTVLTYGTFDIFHIGHVKLLKRLRELGDRLIVGLSTDEFNLEKGKRSFYSYEERKEILMACKYVDMVFPEKTWTQKGDDIKRFQVDILGMGDDWSGKFDYLSSDTCKVIYLSRTEDISTTDIKKRLALITPEEISKMEGILHTMLDLVSMVNCRTGRSDENSR